MRPTVDDVLTALELMSARVPDRHVTPDTPMAAAWLPELERFDRQAVFAAARSWGAMGFPSASEFFVACQAAARQLALDDLARRHDGTLDVGPCPDGCDSGWVESDPTGHGTVHPCELCRPVEHAMWLHRSSPSHPERCADCARIRKGGTDLPGWLVEARQRAVVRGLVAEPTF